MIDEMSLQRLIREAVSQELDRRGSPRRRSAARAAGLMTVPECMDRFRLRRSKVMALVAAGKLTATLRPNGKNGQPQYLISTESAVRLLSPGAK